MPSSLLQSDGGAFTHMMMVSTFTASTRHDFLNVQKLGKADLYRHDRVVVLFGGLLVKPYSMTSLFRNCHFSKLNLLGNLPNATKFLHIRQTH